MGPYLKLFFGAHLVNPKIVVPKPVPFFGGEKHLCFQDFNMEESEDSSGPGS